MSWRLPIHFLEREKPAISPRNTMCYVHFGVYNLSNFVVFFPLHNNHITYFTEAIETVHGGTVPIQWSVPLFGNFCLDIEVLHWHRENFQISMVICVQMDSLHGNSHYVIKDTCIWKPTLSPDDSTETFDNTCYCQFCWGNFTLKCLGLHNAVD